MEVASLDGLARLLQASISPIAMVSGVGLLLLSQTNRFGRITDRLRDLARQRRAAGAARDPRVDEQIQILYRRARLLRSSVSCAVGCVLLASFEVLALFAMAVMKVDLHHFILLLFGLSLVCLIASLVLFLKDLRLALIAIEAELR